MATPLDTAIWSTMGSIIIVLWLATAGVCVILLREHGLAADSRWAVRIGLAVTLLGMATAFPMLLPTADQTAAAQSTDAPRTFGAHGRGRHHRHGRGREHRDGRRLGWHTGSRT